MLAETQLAPQASLSSTPRSSRTLLQRNNDGSGTITAMMNSNPQGHWLGHLLARKRREHRPTHPKHDLQIWHNTPGQYIECTCKLTTTMQQGKIITRPLSLVLMSNPRGLDLF